MNKDERDRKVAQWMPLLYKVVHHFRRTYSLKGRCEVSDLEQEAVIALMFAIENYDPSRGAAFTTYAISCMFRRLQQRLNEWRLIRIPPYLMCSSKQRKSRPRCAMAADRVFFIGQMPNESNIHHPCTPELPAPHQAREQALYKSLDRLNNIDRKLLTLRYGLSGRSHVLREIGEMLGLSKERVRQLLVRALVHLKAQMNSCGAEKTRSGCDRVNRGYGQLVVQR